MSSVAIVTGVSSGLGLELALGFPAEVNHVIGISRKRPADPRWLALGQKHQVTHVMGDVADSDVVSRAFSEACKIGLPTVLINVAGQGVFGPAGNYTKNDLDDVLRGNLVGLILFCERAIADFRKSGGGTIVNVMSTAAHIGRAGEAIYCAAKWGARGYTESIRAEMKGSPVRVIGAYPGGMKTSFWSAARGTTTDSSKFMEAKDVAAIILAAIRSPKGTYVSDIIINRG